MNTDKRSIQRKRQRALKMLALIAGSYANDFLFIALFAYAGTVSAFIPLIHGVAAALVCAAFYLRMRNNRNDERRDQNFTLLQMGAASLIQLGGILLAPQLAFLFLNVLFIVFTFGTLRLSARDAWSAWFACFIATAVCLYQKRAGLGIPHSSNLEVALVALTYMSTLGRCIVVGLYGSAIRIKLRAQNEKLAAFSQEIERLATFDELTGTLNRRSISLLIEERIAASKPDDQTCCVILLDIDHFKSINDRYGHAGGDDVLRAFARVVQSCLRDSDRIGRYGGEEFVVLLPETSLQHAHVIAERIRQSIAALAWADIAPDLSMTVSGGIAEHRCGEPIRALIARADHALYAAKHDGRNRMLIAEFA
jgi:diguanylate cyclase (GGDEF)-like protein